MIRVKKDITGYKYGKLTVMEQVEDYINPKGKHFAKWLCQCECGNFTEVSISNLTGGGVTSCGKCPHDKVQVKENLVGQTFGKLTVLEQATDYISPQGKHMARWLCECSCSEHNRIIVGYTELKNGDTQSCGCLKREAHRDMFKKYNKYDLSGEYGIGWTTNTNEEFYFDLEDYDKIKNYCWITSVDGVYRKLISYDSDADKMVKFSHIIGYKNYDHIDRNPLNNRKNNFRECTQQENSRNRGKQSNNTSGYIGVFWHKKRKKWQAYVTINKKQKIIGFYTDKKEAIVARLKAEQKYYGEFAPQKHLFEQYEISTIQND